MQYPFVAMSLSSIPANGYVMVRNTCNIAMIQVIGNSIKVNLYTYLEIMITWSGEAANFKIWEFRLANMSTHVLQWL